MPLKFSHHLNLMDILGTSIYVLELASLTLGSLLNVGFYDKFGFTLTVFVFMLTLIAVQSTLGELVHPVFDMYILLYNLHMYSRKA